MISLSTLRSDLHGLADPERQRVSQSFFKTSKGQYGHGDIFIGVTVPEMRVLCKTHHEAKLADILELLHSPIHEERFCALCLLVDQYRKGDNKQKDRIYRAYLQNTKWINNWDLVDASAPQIVGEQLLDKKRDMLDRLAKSKNIWERRIAIVATQTFIRKGETRWTIRLAKTLLRDEQDLIHKAVGWMLREVGKRQEGALREFLEKHAAEMPRTMLRYAIEKFSASERKRNLSR